MAPLFRERNTSVRDGAMMERPERFLRRKTLGAFFVLGLLVMQLGTAFPQTPERNWTVDCSMRVEYLFGTQQIRDAVSPNYWNSRPDRLRVDYHPGLWVMSGLCEVSVLSRVSFRLSGSADILSSYQDVARFMFTVSPGPASNQDAVWISFASLLEPSLGGVRHAQTQFRSWEAAGSYHFANDGLYRLGVCAGYRRQEWSRTGSDEYSLLRDTLSSSIPFIGLQAGIFLPGWTGRWEVPGSPFMNDALLAQRAGEDPTATTRATRHEGGLLRCGSAGRVM
jgi:hypothetical protein